MLKNLMRSVKDFFTPNLDQKIFMLEQRLILLNKRIEKGEIQFTDEETVLLFYTLLMNRLKDKHNNQMQLTAFENKALDKVLNDTFFQTSFLLLRDIKEMGYENNPLLEAKLNAEGFELIEEVGYLNVDKTVKSIDISHLEI